MSLCICVVRGRTQSPALNLVSVYMEMGGLRSPVNNFLFYFDHVYMIGGMTRLGGWPGLPGRVTLSAGVTICHVNVSRWGNPLSRGRVHGKKLKSVTCMF